MSPARREIRGRRAGVSRSDSRRRVYADRKRRWVRPVIALLVVAIAGVAFGALYLGFAPGRGTLQGRSASDSAAADTIGTMIAAQARSRLSADLVGDTSSVRLADVDDSTMVAARDSVDGEEVYRQIGRCLGCHGSTGEGAAGLAPSLQLPTMQHGRSLEAIRRVVANGLPATETYRIAMPAYGEQLSGEEIRRVAVFVYTLSHPGRVTPEEGATSGAAPPGRPTVPQRP